MATNVEDKFKKQKKIYATLKVLFTTSTITLSIVTHDTLLHYWLNHCLNFGVFSEETITSKGNSG